MTTTVTGVITQIKLRQDDNNWCMLEIKEADGTTETLILWALDTALPSLATWIARSLNLGLAREALINKLTVTAILDDTSSQIAQLTLLAA